MKHVAALLSVTFALCPYGTVAADGPVLRLTFDHGLESQPGDIAPVKVYGDTATTPGVWGQAVLCKGASRVLYDVTDALNAAAGTLAFWGQPVDWDASAQHFVFFASLLSQKRKEYVRLLSFKNGNSPTFQFLAQNPAAKQNVSLKMPMTSWVPGEWRHVAFTWHEEGTCLYVNGRAVDSGGALALTPVGKMHLLVGAFTGWGNRGEETTAIDELVLYRRALDGEQVATMFDQGLAANPALAAGFAARTKLMERRMRENLSRRGAFVLASSFADTLTYYPDNLLDGDLDTSWRPFHDTFPQWLELHWEYPLDFEQIAFDTVPGHGIASARVQAWLKGTWEQIATVGPGAPADGHYRVIDFERVRTTRLRLVVDQGETDALLLVELEAYGPPQPVPGEVRPYWDAAYIWYPELGDTYRPNVPRYFRKEFTIAEPGAIISASVQAQSNDLYELYLNGVKVASGSKKVVPVTVTEHLRPGENVLAGIAELGSNPGAWGRGVLLAELAIHYPSRTDRVGTGETWRTSDRPVNGWDLPGLDDRAWRKPAVFERPPAGVWGNTLYHYTGPRERVRLVNVTLTPPTARPGETVDVRVTLSAPAKLNDECFFTFVLGDEMLAREQGEYDVAKQVARPAVPTNEWVPGQTVELQTTLELPAHAPDGQTPLRMSTINRRTGVHLVVLGPDGEALDDIAALNIHRFGEEPASGVKMAGSIHEHEGRLGYRIGNSIEPPLNWHYHMRNSYERYHQHTRTGLHLHEPMLYPRGIDDDQERRALGFAILEQHVAALLRIDPDAQLFIRIDVRPTMDWRKTHPEELLLDAFGTRGPVCYASEAYEQLVHGFLRELIAFVKTRPWARRVAGYMPITCGEMDSGLGGADPNLYEADRTKLTLGDWNPQALADFRTWLRDRYNGDVDALRKAWRKTDVTFETAAPERAELVAGGADGGLFRDPSKGRMAQDYLTWLPGLLSTFYQRLAKVIKDETDGQALVKIHYGYVVGHLRAYNRPGSRFQNGDFDFANLLKDDNIDVYHGAPDYGSRRAGKPWTIVFPAASIALHKRLFVADGDYRTFVAGPVLWGRQRSQQESLAVLRKDIGYGITWRAGTWFSDMSRGENRSGYPWFVDEELVRTIGELTDVYRRALTLPRGRAAEIAVIMSCETPVYEDIYLSSALYESLIARLFWDEVHRLGAPFDMHLMSDLSHPDMRTDYKLYIMLNPFYLSADDRKRVDALKAAGKTILWFYAPGYVDNEAGLSTDLLSATVGMTTTSRSGPERLQSVTTDADDPILKDVPPGTRYEVTPYANKRSARLHPAAVSPVFSIDDPQATVLARHPDGTAAFALKEHPTWTSVYSVVPYLDSTTLRNIARRAGVHIYTGDDVLMAADERFLMLHNGVERERSFELRLPRACTVRDAVTGKMIAEDTDRFPVHLPLCHTELYEMAPTEP